MTAVFSTTLRPGLLVGLSTSIKGNVSYETTALESAERAPDGSVIEAWRTDKTIKDAEEHEAASKVRSKARGLISAVCNQTAFGYLCPEVDETKLRKACDEARALCEEFNRTAKVTTIAFYPIIGRINPDDVQAVKAINAEVRNLLDEVAEGVKKCEVEVIRKAASRSLQLGSMLSPEMQARLEVAIKAARKTATEIKAAGEQAAQEVDRATIQRLQEARTAFLDLDGASAFVEPTTATTSRAIDLAPHASEAPAAPAAPARDIDLN